MTIDKACKILKTYRDGGKCDSTKDIKDALTLGIEALKGLGFLRTNYRAFPKIRLPGETEE
jgi:hypothetical protein